MRKISNRTVIVFIFTLALCCSMVYMMGTNRSQVERLNLEQLLSEKNARINDVLTNLLFRAQTLAVNIKHNDGHVENFDKLARMLIDDPAIINVLAAPDGVVTFVYPLEGNEAVVGLDFFSESAGNREAIMAMETGQIVLGGPFRAVQGWDVLVGRMPVFLENDDGSKRFWGIVSITLRHPDALDGVGLDEFEALGLEYELWRINPDNYERQVIMGCGIHFSAGNYIEKPLDLMNAQWYLRVYSVRAWHMFTETWLLFFAGLCMSFLAAAVMQNYQDLKLLKNRLETLSNSDPLTGIYNRRYFMDAATMQMNRVARQKSESFIIMLDLDHFKSVNDKYGHQSGDIVLKKSAERVGIELRHYDLFARYGGEEFIILVTEISRDAAIELTERVRKRIADTPITVHDGAGKTDITVTTSAGIAPAAPANNLEDAIALADHALYRAKDEGRNRVVFLDAADDKI